MTIKTLCRWPTNRTFVLVCICVSFTVTLYVTLTCHQLHRVYSQYKTHQQEQDSNVRYIYDDGNAIAYSDNMELIFVGGVPRSGTTLMRVMLDAHPEVRCGEETRVVPRILSMRTALESKFEKERLLEAGVTAHVLDSAVRAFILEVIAKHGKAAPRLCNKDPFSLKSAIYLSQQFPRSKFILMIRDGRAVVHSIITRNVSITGFNLNSWAHCLHKWNKAMEMMYTACTRIGPTRCLPVYYEQLVLQPQRWLQRVLAFLHLPWTDSVLRHHDLIEQGQISLSRVEKSTNQVKKPLYRDSLSAWVDNIPADVLPAMSQLAPMLSMLGYDPQANPPDYSHPPPGVANNTLHCSVNADMWRHKPRDPFDPDGQGQTTVDQDLPSVAGGDKENTDARLRGAKNNSDQNNKGNNNDNRGSNHKNNNKL